MYLRNGCMQKYTSHYQTKKISRKTFFINTDFILLFMVYFFGITFGKKYVCIFDKKFFFYFNLNICFFFICNCASVLVYYMFAERCMFVLLFKFKTKAKNCFHHLLYMYASVLRHM